jgi:putative MATE family efflux protein
MLFGLVGTGTTALVSRLYGAGDMRGANRVLNNSMLMAAGLGAVATVFVFGAAPTFARLLDFPPDTAAIAVRYLRIDGFGHFFTGVTLIGAAALRGAGNMRAPMFILGFVCVCNIIASTALVFGVGPFPDWGIDRVIVPSIGIDGIVGGTIIARVSGGILMVAALWRGLSGLKLASNELRIDSATTSRILRIGIPAALDGAVTWGGQFVFLMIVSRLAQGDASSAVFAAHVVGIRVEAITYLPAVAWGYASAAMVGQSLGAGEISRATRVGHEAVLQCGLLAAVISSVFFFGARPIYELMHNDSAVREVGIPAFRMLAFFQVPLALSIIYVFALRGAGDTRYPMWCTIFSVIGVRIPVAYLCGIVLDGGLFGAWIGMCADIGVRATLVWWRYTRGRWADTVV